jgi:hypothetical protein
MTEGFGRCLSDEHSATKSVFPKDKIPLALLLEDASDLDSRLFKVCQDCRQYDRARRERKRERRSLVVNGDDFVCAACYITKSAEERDQNQDGSLSLTCLLCKSKSASKRSRARQSQEEIAVAMGCVCEECNCIPLKKKDGVGFSMTRLFDGCVPVHDKRVPLSEFVSNFRSEIDFRNFTWDHLTETEQRQRGILTDGMPFEPKKESISNLMSRSAKQKESSKTQLLCLLCHVKVTARRTPGKSLLSATRMSKKAHINSKKREIGYCAYCNVSCDDVSDAELAYFQFDHINQSTKFMAVSQMKSYSLAKIDAEIAKCQLLCMYCHQIRTAGQNRKVKQ